MVPGFVYESCTDQIRSEPIPQLIFGLAYLLILTRFVWPLQLPLSIKILVAALASRRGGCLIECWRPPAHRGARCRDAFRSLARACRPNFPLSCRPGYNSVEVKRPREC